MIFPSRCLLGHGAQPSSPSHPGRNLARSGFTPPRSAAPRCSGQAAPDPPSLAGRNLPISSPNLSLACLSPVVPGPTLSFGFTSCPTRCHPRTPLPGVFLGRKQIPTQPACQPTPSSPPLRSAPRSPSRQPNGPQLQVAFNRSPRGGQQLPSQGPALALAHGGDWM